MEEILEYVSIYKLQLVFVGYTDCCYFLLICINMYMLLSAFDVVDVIVLGLV